MAIPPLPPLRVREADGSPNLIPVFEIVVTNGTLKDLGGGRVELATGGAAGSDTVYAATGNQYVVLAAAADLVEERVLTGGSGLGVLVVDSGAGNAVYVVANTVLLVTSTRAINTTAPVAGGGNLGADRTITVDTAVLVTSARTISTTYPLAGGGNLSANRTLFVTTGGAGQMLITTGGVTGDIAWVNTAGGSASTTVIQFPLALSTVEVTSANAFWANTAATNVDLSAVRFVDGGRGIATYWGKVPYNINATPAWSLILDHMTSASSGGNVHLNVYGKDFAAADTMDVALTLLANSATLATNSAGILSVTAVSGANFDSVEALSAGNYLIVKIQRNGEVTGDTVGGTWWLFTVNVQCTVNT